MISGCLTAAVMALAACQRGPSPEELALNESKAENAKLQNELRSRDSLIGDMTLSFDEIERNLSLVEEKEKLVTSEAQGAELGMDKRQKIVRDIQLMNGLMKESRDKIAELEGRLDKSKIEAGGLRKKLKELDEQLAARDVAITA
jgi:predicted  nucleic acid-binding Zn-ribbon protein